MGGCMSSLHKVGVLYTLKISTEDFNQMRTYVSDYTEEELIDYLTTLTTYGINTANPDKWHNLPKYIRYVEDIHNNQ